MAEGIDVYSRYQTVKDWHAVKASGRSFVYVKLSDGSVHRDDLGYVAAAKAAGLRVGGYHFAQGGDPIAQADLLCARVATLGAMDLAPALDAETPATTNAPYMIAFLNRVKKYGHRPCLYASNSILETQLAAVQKQIPDVLVWVARYGGSPTVPYDLWQYTSSGIVPGIAEHTDLSRGALPLNYHPAQPGGDNDMDPRQATQLDKIHEQLMGTNNPWAEPGWPGFESLEYPGNFATPVDFVRHIDQNVIQLAKKVSDQQALIIGLKNQADASAKMLQAILTKLNTP